jgi:hypothetical protein
VKGNVVRGICSNATLSEQGFFRWDGLDLTGNRLATGVYIVLTELFDVQGNKKIFKNTVTLAHRL